MYPDLQSARDDPIPDVEKLPTAARCVGGALRFFLGRDLVFDAAEYSDDPIISDRGYASYGRLERGSDMMVASVRMQNYTKTELTQGRGVPLPAHANPFAQPQDMEMHGKLRDYNQQNPSSAESGRETLDAPADRKWTPLHYAAWTTSTIHDVRPLQSGYRFVITYKMLRAGEEVWRVPPVKAFSSKFEAFLEEYKKKHVQAAADLPAPSDQSIVERPRFTCFAFLCRHTYPPATLTPSALRRIDATAYYALTAKWEVVLTPVLVLRNPVQAVPFGILSRGEGSQHITLFLSAEFHAESPAKDVAWTDEKLPDEVCDRLPIIMHSGCMELGFGEVLREGSSYGNGDCSADFWYRSAAMICTFKPSDWARKRVAFLILQRGRNDDMNLIKKISHLYPVFRNIVSFL
jgi:hypothetical protein